MGCTPANGYPGSRVCVCVLRARTISISDGRAMRFERLMLIHCRMISMVSEVMVGDAGCWNDTRASYGAAERINPLRSISLGEGI